MHLLDGKTACCIYAFADRDTNAKIGEATQLLGAALATVSAHAQFTDLEWGGGVQKEV